MSAESPRRGVHKGAQVISPQPVNDRSIIDSVAGIINDIVPQAYSGAQNAENKESITWARFEYADINDPTFYPDCNEGSNIPPLLLVLGYATGVQVWLIAASGEATEVLSWRQGSVRALRILPNPRSDDKREDSFESKRPMIAMCDSATPGLQFTSVVFISLRTGEQTKSIKFKKLVCDVLANERSVVITFVEKIAVFDAKTLEDVVTVTTCYPSPGPNPNPVALGTRWLAYSEKKLLPARRSSGGSEGEGVQSYTATVLYAAKSLGKGLRGLGETVASSLTGNSVTPVGVNQAGSEVTQPGIVTIIDLEAAKEEKEKDDSSIETVIAHFAAHNEAIVAMTFDLTGAILMTADKRGHDFHVFRIQPHPGGPTLAAVHHLYVLHRGDTTAKVQDMAFSNDTRWAAISTVRGTTHVFPVAPYGGPVGVRTHSTPHVVNRLSRFHRSAGLTDDGARSHSPVSQSETPLSIYPYTNPRLPPYPHPTKLHPLAQIRQPSSLHQVNSQPQPRSQQRPRLLSDDSVNLPVKICACFAPPRAWIYAQRDSTNKITKRAVDSLFIMACHGNMIQYDLEPKPASGIPKEKVCDDTAIELDVEVKGQWPLLRSPGYFEIIPPLSSSSPFLNMPTMPKNAQHLDTAEDRWLSQVEIVTHAGPHRRLWMGPQFVFKTYNAPSGASVNLVETETVDIGVTGGSRPARSNPVNMPHAASRPLVPVVIDGSGSSYEQSPRFMEAYGDSLDNDNIGIGIGENQLREDLAEAMLETSTEPHCVPGRRLVIERVGQPVTKVVNPLGTVITVSADEEDINSSQEFDPVAEETTPEPPRSVCAEEGPASLGDFESECQALREHTEICAEMRSASEPTIDSVPDHSIREVKEKKSLCAEAAAMVGARSAIDFEREEAFSDVPTGLSLCAEQGEIPSSPMTQARESAWNEKGVQSRELRGFAKAKYVVSYDEDSVVLMENKSPGGKSRKGITPSSKSKKTYIAKTEGSPKPIKFLLKEKTDSVIVEDLLPRPKTEEPEKTVDPSEESSKASTTLSFVEVQPEDTSQGDISSTSSTRDTDELAAMKYHVVDKNVSSNQSDEDIVHVPGFVATSSPKNSTNDKDDFEDSASRRKNSKSTISDDDMEHIHSSELAEMEEKQAGTEISPKTCQPLLNRNVLSSDDDLEHVSLHSELESVTNETKQDESTTTSGKSKGKTMKKKKEDSSCEAMESADSTCKKKESDSKPASGTQGSKKGRSKSIKSGVVGTSGSSRRATQSLQDTVEIIDIDAEIQKEEEMFALEMANVDVQKQKESDKPACSLVRSTVEADPEPYVTPLAVEVETDVKRSTAVEIIDIDAERQKAELELPGEAVIPECKILESMPECKIVESRQPLKHSKTGKRGKKQQSNDHPCREKLETTDAAVAIQPSNSWSSIVKRKTKASCVEPEESGPAPEASKIELEASKTDLDRSKVESEVPKIKPKVPSAKVVPAEVSAVVDEEGKESQLVTKATNRLALPPRRSVKNKKAKNEVAPPEGEKELEIPADSEDNEPRPVPEDLPVEKTVEPPVLTKEEEERESEIETEKRSDSEQEAVLVEKSSSSSDDLNPKLVIFEGNTDVDEDGMARDKSESGPNGPPTLLPTWASLPAKKSNRSKKKKRR